MDSRYTALNLNYRIGNSYSGSFSTYSSNMSITPTTSPFSNMGGSYFGGSGGSSYGGSFNPYKSMNGLTRFN